jgi:hypothetical protein
MIKLIKKSFNQTSYPLMRDPTQNPKCYEMTDYERKEAAHRVDELLRKKALEESQVYYGA